jgi:haemagglutination activity domain
VALNRVTGPDPSQIAGRIDANGQFVLVNQSGVNFYRGAQVNAAGVMVSAAGISNQHFMAGQMVFDQPAHANAKISNAGRITVKQAGLAALVAPQVANSGTINAQLGHVVLAGAKTATLDLYGDGLLSLDVTNQVTEAPVGADGKKATALVTNSGVVVADGGTVQLTARAADGIVQNLVQAGGKIRAATIGDRTGTIALNGVGGSIVVAGQLSAPGRAPGTRGGNVEVVADGAVTLASTARINASGQAGGGTVAVGTTLARARGGAGVTAVRPAKNLTVQQGATIATDAKADGNGGRVAVVSDQAKGTTQMDGAISARGGPQGGDGGFVDTSGFKLGVGNSAAINVGAQASAGRPGTWLLDPIDVTIDAATATSLEGTLNSGGDAVVSTSVSGMGQGNITVVAPVIWTKSTSLTLSADNDIAVKAAITGNSGSFIVSAGNSNSTGSISIRAPISAGSITLSSGSAGSIREGGAGAISTSGLLTTDSSTGTTLNGKNAVGSFTAANSTSGNISLTNAGSLRVLGITNSGDRISIRNSGDLTIARPVDAGGGTVTLRATEGLLAVDGQVNGGNVILRTDNLNITAPISAPDGTVAIAPATAGRGMSLDMVRDSATLSLLQSDLNQINAATLALGSVDGGTTLLAGSQAVNAPTTLTRTAGTLQLFSLGSISGAGSLAVATLEGRATGAVSLPGTNNIGSLGGSGGRGFDATGETFSLADPRSAALTVNSLTAETINLAAPGIVVPGTLTAATSATLIAGRDGIAGTGVVSTPLLLGSSTGSVTLSAANLIDALGASATSPFDASGNAFVLNSTKPLAVNGVTAATVGLTAPGIAVPGSATGTTSVTLTAGSTGIGGSGVISTPLLLGSSTGDVTLGGANLIDTLGIGAASPFNAAGKAFALHTTKALTVNGVTAATIALTAPSIAVPGALTGTTSANLTATNGGINGSGSITTAALSGRATADATLSGAANQIATLGNFTASGITLNDAASLTISGIVNGGPNATLTDTGTITVAPSGALIGNTLAVTATNDVILNGLVQSTNANLVSTSGNISAPGTLITSLLTGSTAGDATFSGSSNQVARVANFTATNFTLVDSIPVTVTGPLTANNSIKLSGSAVTLNGSVQAPTIVVHAGDNPIALTGKAIITTGGIVRPLNVLNFPGDSPSTEVNGAYFSTSAGFSQQGSTTIQGIGAGRSVMRTNASNGASITFDLFAGLQGKNTWTILSLDTGTAIGQIKAKDLDVIRSGASGSTNLTGTVANLSGPAAAGAAGIQPSPNPDFRFNGCTIHAVSCILAPAEAVPVASPLNDIFFGSVLNPNEEDDLLLPIVSDLDY